MQRSLSQRPGRRRTRAWAVLAALAAPTAAWSGGGPPGLSREHTHPSGAFWFRTPEGWTETILQTDPGALQVAGDGMIVRFLFQRGEAGYDALHGHCMTQRLAEAPQTDPWIDFEYDFLSGDIENRRFLDSAFHLRYDAPIQGHRVWRQRNMTVVGAGQSLCIIVYAPSEVWKKSKTSRALADAVVRSVAFR